MTLTLTSTRVLANGFKNLEITRVVGVPDATWTEGKTSIPGGSKTFPGAGGLITDPLLNLHKAGIIAAPYYKWHGIAAWLARPVPRST